MGGGDEDANLVRLTYREHFIVHWLLTKICTGRDLRKMQFALHAMTLPISGQRIVAGWQFEVAKRALVTEEMIERAEARARTEYIKKNHRFVIEARRTKLKEAMELMGLQKPLISKWSPIVQQELPNSTTSDREQPERRKRRRRRPRPGKRARMKIRQGIVALAS